MRESWTNGFIATGKLQVDATIPANTYTSLHKGQHYCLKTKLCIKSLCLWLSLCQSHCALFYSKVGVKNKLAVTFSAKHLGSCETVPAQPLPDWEQEDTSGIMWSRAENTQAPKSSIGQSARETFHRLSSEGRAKSPLSFASWNRYFRLWTFTPLLAFSRTSFQVPWLRFTQHESQCAPVFPTAWQTPSVIAIPPRA